MPIVAADWTVTRSNGNVRYVGDDHGGASPSYATVIELHRWLQGLADDASSSGDDELDITDENPSNRSTDNIITMLGNYNIDATAAEHLYDGSIIQSSGATIYDGIVNFGNADVQIQIIQDGAVLTDDWWNEGGAGLNADATAGISHRFMILVRDNDVDIDGRKLIGTTRTFGNTYGEFVINSTARGNNVLALTDTTDLNNQTAVGTVGGWGITNQTEGYVGLDVKNDSTNEFYYSEWDRDTQTINDLYEFAKREVRDGSAETLYGLNGENFRGITHQFDYDAEASGGLAEGEEAVWGTTFNYDNEASGPFTVGEYLSFSVSGARAKLLQLTDNGATGSMIVDEVSGTIADGNQITGLTSGATADVDGATTDGGVAGGRAQVLAIDDNGATGTIWWQLLSGSTPADNQTVYRLADTADTVDVDGSFTSRSISTPFIGASTGSALIGAYGVGVEPTDLSAADSVIDLGDTTVTPPNFVTLTMAGLVSGEDRVLVYPWDGSTLDAEGNPAIERDQFGLNTTLNGAAETSVVIDVTIPTDTPSAATVFVELDNGDYLDVGFTATSGSTFTIPSTDFSVNNATAGNNVWIGYIHELASGTTASYTAVYGGSDRDLGGLVRDGDSTPIKEFITPMVFGNANSTTTAIRTSDE